MSQITPEAWEPIRAELQGIALVRVEDEIQIGDRPFLRFHPTLAMRPPAATYDPQLQPNPKNRQSASRRLHERYLTLMQALDKALTGLQSRAALEILDREEANYRTAVRWAVADQAYARPPRWATRSASICQGPAGCGAGRVGRLAGGRGGQSRLHRASRHLRTGAGLDALHPRASAGSARRSCRR